MKELIFVYGPQGCGKTTNAVKISSLLNADSLIDEGKVPNLFTCILNDLSKVNKVVVLTAEDIDALISKCKKNSIKVAISFVHYDYLFPHVSTSS